ncbi:MAG: hypothetical protein E6Z12_02700 [Finegoldia magna]|nr:hypothetical protein [Finegoldia magna]
MNTATNIQLHPLNTEKNCTIYFQGEVFPIKTYSVREYINPIFATQNSKIVFTIQTEFKELDVIYDFVSFKLKYSDLIGNMYTQSFRFGYMPGTTGNNNKIEFNLKQKVGKPILVRKFKE